MDLSTLTEFFKWCTVINIGVFLWSTAWLVVAPNFVYRMQSWFLPLDRPAYDQVVVMFLGLFKLGIIVFCLTPYLALLIVG